MLLIIQNLSQIITLQDIVNVEYAVYFKQFLINAYLKDNTFQNLKERF